MMRQWFVELIDDKWCVIDYSKDQKFEFETKEWAQVCARHFNKLEDARYEPFIMTTYDTFTVNSTNLGVGNVYNTNSYQFRPTPESSGWKCEMFGLGNQLVLMPNKGKVPNFFWRWTQYIIFGNKWIKEK